MTIEIRVESPNRDSYDPMTGVLNKDAFYLRTRQLLDENPDLEYDFITSDIEHFRVINDLHGYEMGDELLVHVAESLKENADRFDGICGRYFADIFMLVLPRQQGLLDRLVASTARFIVDGPIKPSPKVRIGVYPIEDRTLPVSAMYDRSVLALSTVRPRQKVEYAIFEEKQREKILKEQMILRSVDAAMEDGEIFIYLQPKYSLATRRINGAEALVRWVSPTEGFISPADFIPVLEDKGLIFRLDLFVWELACKVMRRWIEEGKPTIPISVNVSRVDMEDPDFEQAFLDLIDQYQIPPGCFILEITETSYANLSARHIELIEDLRSRGFRVEMDDFGSGYSSLNMLKDFFVDDLKIDLGFLTGIGENDRGEKILRLVVDLAKDLELGVIAEGVEESHQADFLTGIGCHTAQGYYFAKPMSVGDFEDLFEQDQEDAPE